MKARILLLRITVPVDVYSSPILVEVDGVEAQISSLTDGERIGKVTKPKSRSDHDRKRDKPGGFRRDSLPEEGGLPSADDLAQSFLQTEPEEEKKELEAAINSQSQYLAASVAMSEDGDGDDEDIEVGTGAGLALPAFMANFLKGIVDRLQVRVQGIVFNLDLQLPNENPNVTGSLLPQDTVTIQISVEDVDIEGVTFRSDDSRLHEGAGRQLRKDGKRLINLTNLRGTLITEAALFASLARSSAMSSPSTTHTDLVEGRSRSWATRSQRTAKSNSASESDGSESLDKSLRLDAIESSTYSTAAASDQSRYHDASGDDDEHLAYGDAHFHDHDTRGNMFGDSMLGDSTILGGITDSQLLESNRIEMARSYQKSDLSIPGGHVGTSSPLTTPKASVYMPPPADDSYGYFMGRPAIPSRCVESDHLFQTTTALPVKRYSESRVSQSQPLPGSKSQVSVVEPEHSGNSLATPISTRARNDLSDPEDDSPASTPDGEDDLAQSMVFSHAEAESMYMSAMSTEPQRTHMPGGWDESVYENASSSADVETPDIHDIPRQASHDNLEHAMQASITSTKFHSPEQSMQGSVTSDAQSSPNARSSPPSSDINQLQESGTAGSVPQKRQGSSSASSAFSDGPNRIAKQLFCLDQAAIYLPPASDPSALGTTNESERSVMFSSTFANTEPMSQSAGPILPGTFSVRGDKPKSSITSRGPSDRPTEPRQASTSKPAEGPEMKIGKFDVQFDISVGRLIARLIQKVLQMVKHERQPVQPLPREERSSSPFSIRFQAELISFKFLERLVGTMIAPDQNALIDAWSKVAPADILLQATMKGLDISSTMKKSVTNIEILLQKFLFGYAEENIVSFDSDLRMRESVRDLAAPAGVDISVSIAQTHDTTRVRVSALPIHIAIDLQRLDETFSWFGGLSGVLNMGSSMTSNVTIPATTPKTPPKPRGVRFEAPIKVNDKSLAAQNKVDARIGGFHLDLVGRQCMVGIDTTAVKIISREEAIAMAVDYIKISGPHVHDLDEDPAIVAELSSTRVEFLSAPQDVDLTRLLALITPSKAKYDEDDDILLDTLLRQRRQGSVLRLTVDGFRSRVSKLKQLEYLPALGEEVSRLSTVAKYLPEDDRPGLLSLVLVHEVDVKVEIDNILGSFKLNAKETEIAQITLPSLVATSINAITLHRNGSEEIIGAATPVELRELNNRSPAIMARMIGDEMDPKVKLKLWNLSLEYRVPFLMALLDLPEATTTEDMIASMATSVATLTGRARAIVPAASIHETGISKKSSDKNPMNVNIVLRDCILGLNPMGLTSKVLVVMSQAHVSAVLPKDNKMNTIAELNKGSVLVIDDVANLNPATHPSTTSRRLSYDGGSGQVMSLCQMGYVSVSYISSAKAVVHITGSEEGGDKSVDVELRDDLFILESCADSTQTLIAALNGLKPPIPPSKELKFRTNVVPIQDLLASLSGDAFGTAEGMYNMDEDFPDAKSITSSQTEDEQNLEMELDSRYYIEEDLEGSVEDNDYRDSREGSMFFDQDNVSQVDTSDGVLLESISEHQESEEAHEELDFKEEHFGSGSMVEGTAHRWESKKNRYVTTDTAKIRASPLKVCVRDVHIIWNLFDGYDWQGTRNAITKAVQNVETKAVEKRAKNDRRPTFEQDLDDEETVIGDFLFNSIYIGIPSNKDPGALAAAINQELNDNATETESIAPTMISTTPSRPGSAPRIKGKRLRLNRSKHHKITFELKGVNVDLVAFPPGSGETQSSIDIRVHDLDVFDHVPTSTWKKFATYMHDAGERESEASQIHIEILNVKPMPELAASEIVMKVTVLPIRLHVDQDALDFITRFFEFKADSAPTSDPPGDVPFLQRVEVNAIQVKLDFKPKRVDYAGLRSGRTTEFMNFIVLDGANMTMRHTIIYGVSGFDKLGKCLNDIWMPDIKRNQLPGILAGLAPVRSVASFGGGFIDLVKVPIVEYRKDGRLVRSIRKGAFAFGKTTGIEVVKLAAKLAIGTQTMLTSAEEFLNGPKSPTSFDEDDPDGEERNIISPYADQPIGIIQGGRRGWGQLRMDLLSTKDVIIAVPGQVMESGTAVGAAKAVGKNLPTIILTPLIGISKAVGQTALGIGNELDPQAPRRFKEVSQVYLLALSLSILCAKSLTPGRNTKGHNPRIHINRLTSYEKTRITKAFYIIFNFILEDSMC